MKTLTQKGLTIQASNESNISITDETGFEYFKGKESESYTWVDQVEEIEKAFGIKDQDFINVVLEAYDEWEIEYKKI